MKRRAVSRRDTGRPSDNAAEARGYQRGLLDGRTQGALTERKLIAADQQRGRNEAVTRLVDALAQIATSAATVIGESGPKVI